MSAGKKRAISFVALLLLLVLQFRVYIAVDNVSNEFKNDEDYLSYPYSLSKLEKEQAIVKLDSILGITKIYVYNDKGKLIRIHLPLLKYTLFIDKYGEKGGYVLVDDTNERSNIIRIIGGPFNNVNTQYIGGSGLSDLAVEDTYLRKIIDITRSSINETEKAIKEYEKKTGTILTEADYSKSVDASHPLMKIEGMNFMYFFDGHGERLKFERKSNKELKVYSKYSIADEKLKREFDNWGTGLVSGEDIKALKMFLLKVAVFIFISSILIITILILYYKRKKK